MYIYIYKLYSNIDNGLIDVDIINNEVYSINDKIIDSVFYDNNDGTLLVNTSDCLEKQEKIKEYIDSFVSNICYNLSISFYSLNRIVLFEFLECKKLSDNSDIDYSNFLIENDDCYIKENESIEKKYPKDLFYEEITKDRFKLRTIYNLFNFNNRFALQYIALYDYIENEIRDNKNIIFKSMKNCVVADNYVAQFVAEKYGVEHLTETNDKGTKKLDKYSKIRHNIAHFNANSVNEYLKINSIKASDLLELINLANDVFTEIKLNRQN